MIAFCRNKWLIQPFDVVVTYVPHIFGGVSRFKEIAVKQGKNIITFRLHYNTMQ